jgi:hexosaminidase
MNHSMKKILLTTLVAIHCSFMHGTNATSIIPAPARVEEREGHFELTAASRIQADREFKNEAQLLADRLRPATGFRVKIKPLGKNSPGEIVLMKANGEGLPDEGYELSVTASNVVIRAATPAGIFYGVQSLLQLLPTEIFYNPEEADITQLDAPAKFVASLAAKVNWQIPCVEIKDQPRFAWRGFMLDVSRHFFTKKEVEQVLDAMALYKLNTFHWHLVDDQGWRIQIKKYPKLTSVGAWRDDVGFGLDPKSATAYDKRGRYGGFYTQKEIREVVTYAAARHITIVPEIEMPGHSAAALKAYPQFLCPGVKIENLPRKGGIFRGVYCAGNDATFTFLGNVLSEVTKLFPGKYIHIGGDEVVKSNWMACADCQLRIKTEHLKDERELQAYFIGRIEKIVNADGKSLIGWSEIREGGLAPSAALMDWIGGGAESAASGHDVVMSPTKYCYFDHYQSTNRIAEPKAIGGFLPLEQVYAFDPMPTNLPPEFHSHVLGGQANLWTEYVPNLRHAEYMMFPRLGALAEVDWSPKDTRDWPDFEARTALNEKRLDAMGVNYRPLAKREQP